MVFKRYSFVLFFGGVAASLILWTGCSRPDSSDQAVFKKAPDFHAEVFYPRKQPRFHLAEINRSKPILIVFWATWCPSCREEIPKLNHLSAAYQEKLAVVSVNAQEDPAEIQSFLSSNPVDFPVLLDGEGRLAELFEVTAIPTIVLLAKGGKILYYGFRLPDAEKLESALTA